MVNQNYTVRRPDGSTVTRNATTGQVVSSTPAPSSSGGSSGGGSSNLGSQTVTTPGQVINGVPVPGGLNAAQLSNYLSSKGQTTSAISPAQGGSLGTRGSTASIENQTQTVQGQVINGVPVPAGLNAAQISNYLSSGGRTTLPISPAQGGVYQTPKEALFNPVTQKLFYTDKVSYSPEVLKQQGYTNPVQVIGETLTKLPIVKGDILSERQRAIKELIEKKPGASLLFGYEPDQLISKQTPDTFVIGSTSPNQTSPSIDFFKTPVSAYEVASKQTPVYIPSATPESPTIDERVLNYLKAPIEFIKQDIGSEIYLASKLPVVLAYKSGDTNFAHNLNVVGEKLTRPILNKLDFNENKNFLSIPGVYRTLEIAGYGGSLVPGVGSTVGGILIGEANVGRELEQRRIYGEPADLPNISLGEYGLIAGKSALYSIPAGALFKSLGGGAEIAERYATLKYGNLAKDLFLIGKQEVGTYFGGQIAGTLGVSALNFATGKPGLGKVGLAELGGSLVGFEVGSYLASKSPIKFDIVTQGFIKERPGLDKGMRQDLAKIAKEQGAIIGGSTSIEAYYGKKLFREGGDLDVYFKSKKVELTPENSKTFYHGTTDKNVDKILKEGIAPPKETGQSMGLNKIPNKVYLTASYEDALGYANRAKIKENLLGNRVEPEVLKISIPTQQYASLFSEMRFGIKEEYSFKNVPSEFISKATSNKNILVEDYSSLNKLDLAFQDYFKKKKIDVYKDLGGEYYNKRTGQKILEIKDISMTGSKRFDVVNIKGIAYVDPLQIIKNKQAKLRAIKSGKQIVDESTKQKTIKDLELVKSAEESFGEPFENKIVYAGFYRAKGEARAKPLLGLYRKEGGLLRLKLGSPKGIGSDKLFFPELSEANIATYPQSPLETAIKGKQFLKESGVEDVDITKIESAKTFLNLLENQKSAFLKNAKFPEQTKVLSLEETSFVKEFAKENKNSFLRIYGSFSDVPQRLPELKRIPGDIEFEFKSEESAKSFGKALVEKAKLQGIKLQLKEGKGVGVYKNGEKALELKYGGDGSDIENSIGMRLGYNEYRKATKIEGIKSQTAFEQLIRKAGASSGIWSEPTKQVGEKGRIIIEPPAHRPKDVVDAYAVGLSLAESSRRLNPIRNLFTRKASRAEKALSEFREAYEKTNRNKEVRKLFSELDANREAYNRQIKFDITSDIKSTSRKLDYLKDIGSYARVPPRKSSINYIISPKIKATTASSISLSSTFSPKSSIYYSPKLSSNVSSSNSSIKSSIASSESSIFSSIYSSPSSSSSSLSSRSSSSSSSSRSSSSSSSYYSPLKKKKQSSYFPDYPRTNLKKKSSTSFDVYEIERGKQKLVRRGVTKGVGLDILSRDLLGSLKATGFLRKSNAPLTSTERTGEFELTKELFRSPTAKSRYRNLGDIVLVQKQSKTRTGRGRLTTRGERLEIQSRKRTKMEKYLR